MSRYRTHTCGELRPQHVGCEVRLSGWVHRKRDHGQLLFLDLRDHHGVTQVVFERARPQGEPDPSPEDPPGSPDDVRLESVITVCGNVVRRGPENVNARLATGEVELTATKMELLSASDAVPFPINSDGDVPEDQRLRYRFLDLRRERLHANVVLRSRVIASLRRRMIDAGFLEFQTPILTSSSPEGARDYLVPSRIHPGSFYALPQAPQQFKQLLMVAGFDRYFQIAPCFRDEDARADRSPGEFYQLDVEMSFVDQDEVFETIEPVLAGVFGEFSSWNVNPPPFPRIAYSDAMVWFGSDKPDLRNPIRAQDVTAMFTGSPFAIFARAIEKGACVRTLRGPGAADRPRAFFDRLTDRARASGAKGLAYVVVDTESKGPVAKALPPEQLQALYGATGTSRGDALFFLCDRPKEVARQVDAVRTRLGEELGLLEQDAYRFCWIVDFPFFEPDSKSGRPAFSHNPFSMPQGGLEALESTDPLKIKAHQYDIVCNGVELSSGAIRNHRPDIMLRAFAIAGYSAGDVRARFPGMLEAFRFGAPPHGGLAPGVDRMVMLLAREPNLREVIAFPMNQNAQDLMMNAPSPVSDEQLEELHIRLAAPVAPTGSGHKGEA